MAARHRPRRRRLLEVLKNHPNALALLVAQVPVGPNALSHRERSLAVLLSCGFPVDLAARAYTAVAHYVVGFALQQHAPGAPQPGDAARLRDFYRALDADVYPATVAAADDLTSVPLDDEFGSGCSSFSMESSIFRKAARLPPSRRSRSEALSGVAGSASRLGSGQPGALWTSRRHGSPA